jgi:hypothetical protein
MTIKSAIGSTHDCSWTDDNAKWGDGLCHDCSRTNDAAFPDRDASKHNCACANPSATLNINWF